MKRKLFKGIFTIDLCIAIIILLFIIYYSLLIFDSIYKKFSEEKKEIDKIKLFVYSEKLVKRKVKEDKLAYMNEIDKDNLTNEMEKDMENFGFNYLKINEVEIGKKKENVYCIERLVIENGEIKKLQICA
ncbi:MAG: hypothetical protein QXI58_02080 [Candidatus Micrarchaeia archaeon]